MNQNNRPTILLVENDALILRMYQKKLELDGYNVVTAMDGTEALQEIRTTKPDLILCEVMMPEVNGSQVLQAVKADESLRTIPIIMLTNLSDEHEATAAIEHGAITYLIKSKILPSDVVAKVKEVLKVHGLDPIPVAVPIMAAAG